MQVAEAAGRRYTALRAHLDERQRRLLLGVEAAELGRGGIKAIAAVTGVHPDTIGRGVGEMEGNPQPQTRVRTAGGGRKKLAESESTTTPPPSPWPPSAPGGPPSARTASPTRTGC